MYFVLIGVGVILLHLAGIGPMADWNWNFFGDLWKFCLPFIFAAVWWAWADLTGYNKRREMEKMETKKQARREANLEALGMDKRARRKKAKATGRS
jgi:small Trp-rich protein